ncbi:MAG TPA: DinB family protein [Gemmatimonadaceae bacterium]|nr:DinB family protein [Gemmatimonadaceae bacterium]
MIAATATKSAKQQFLEAFERETATTIKVLKAYPEDQSELRPQEKMKTARELAAMFTMEMAAIDAAVRGTFTFPPRLPPMPQNWKEVVEAFEKTRAHTLEGLREVTEESLASGSISFPTAPKTVSPWQKLPFAWFLLFDQIHHRGQLSVYLRLAGGKLPSIYGPTADEPWT